MRTFQYSGEGSHKFWNIALNGKEFTVTYGKIGTAGQSQTKSWPTEEKAKQEAEKLIKEKTNKGYNETTPKAITSEDEALIKAIQAHPNDPAVHSAYADWLIERGDPRGEFMQVQLALQDETLSGTARKKLQEKEATLLKKHQSSWVGDWVKTAKPPKEEYGTGLGPFGKEVLHFQDGLLKGIAIGELTVATARGIIADDKLKFVNTLFVGDIPYDESDDDEEAQLEGPDLKDVEEHHAQHILVRWMQLKHITKFYWGWYPKEPKKPTDLYYSCHMPGNMAYDYVKQMPNLEELRLCCHIRDAKKIINMQLPNLRFLQLYHGWDFPLDKLADNKSMTNLETLWCHPHGLEHGDDPYIRYKHIKAICKSPYLGKLKHLRLRGTDLGDKGVKDIVDLGLLKRLKVLELQLGCISDEGAELLAKCPDLKNLELLDLSQNGLTKKGIDLLKKTGVNLVALQMHDQTEYDEDGDNEFLWQGDAE